MKKSLLFIFTLIGIGASAQWSPQASGFSSPSRGINHIVAVDNQTAWAVAYDGMNTSAYIQELTHTNNQGTTWTEAFVTGGNTGALGIGNACPINYDTCWISMFDYQGGFGADQGVYVTYNSGSTWTKQTGAAYTTGSFPNVVHFWDKNIGWAMGDPKGGYYENYRTWDGGNTWVRTANTGNQLNPNVASEYGLTNVYTVLGNTIWYGTTHGRIFRSLDTGSTWTVANTPWYTTAANPTNNGISKICFVDQNNGIATHYNSTTQLFQIAGTSDGGQTWTTINPSGPFFASDVCAVPGTNMYVSVGARPSFHGSSMSNDGGMTWHLMEDTTVATVGMLIQRTAVEFADATTGWSGSFNQDQVTGGMYLWSGAVVGINNNNSVSSSVKVYPNPAREILSLQLNGFDKNETEVKLYSITGSLVYESKNKYESPIYLKHINLNNLASGVYMLHVNDGEHNFVQKIVKQ